MVDMGKRVALLMNESIDPRGGNINFFSLHTSRATSMKTYEAICEWIIIIIYFLHLIPALLYVSAKLE